MKDIEKYVEGLIKKAAETEDSSDAMRFSQAATNAANAAACVSNIQNKPEAA